MFQKLQFLYIHKRRMQKNISPADTKLYSRNKCLHGKRSSLLFLVSFLTKCLKFEVIVL